jgi:uncharacterized protein (DUF2236 family)
MPLRIADVSAEAILLAGGARAILLQVANPRVGSTVAEHSDFANRPLDRLHGTLTYLYVTVYGTPEEAAIVARQVGAAHRSVPGANDVSLQLWVAATIYETAMFVRSLVYGPLSEDDAETLLADYSVLATALGVPRGEWPSSPAAFADYWANALTQLRVDAAAERIAHDLLHPRLTPLWLKAALPFARFVTAGLLDDPLRTAYRLPFNERRFERFVRFARVVYPRLPRRVRHAPMRHYVREFRRRLVRESEAHGARRDVGAL